MDPLGRSLSGKQPGWLLFLTTRIEKCYSSLRGVERPLDPAESAFL